MYAVAKELQLRRVLQFKNYNCDVCPQDQFPFMELVFLVGLPDSGLSQQRMIWEEAIMR